MAHAFTKIGVDEHVVNQIRGYILAVQIIAKQNNSYSYNI
jgi:hypothetical protein